MNGFGDDVERAVAELAGMERDLKGVLLEATRQGAEVIRREAEARAPRRTGRLAANIVLKDEDTDAEDGDVSVAVAVSGDAFYGRFLEYGTVKMGAQPFIRPAVDRKRREAGDVIRREVERAVGRVVGFRSRRRG